MKKKLNILFDGDPSNKYFTLIDHFGKVTPYFHEVNLKRYTTFIIDCQNPSKNWGAADFKEILEVGLGLVLLEPNDKDCKNLTMATGRKLQGQLYGVITKILKDIHGESYYFCDAVSTEGKPLPPSLSSDLIVELKRRVVQVVTLSSSPPCSENGLLPNVNKSPTAVLRRPAFEMIAGLEIQTDYYFYHENATGGTGNLDQYYAILVSSIAFDYTKLPSTYNFPSLSLSMISANEAPFPEGVVQGLFFSPQVVTANTYNTVLKENKIQINMRVIENGTPTNKSFSPSFCNTTKNTNWYSQLLYFYVKNAKETNSLEIFSDSGSYPSQIYGKERYVILLSYKISPPPIMKTLIVNFKYFTKIGGKNLSSIQGPFDLNQLTKLS